MKRSFVKYLLAQLLFGTNGIVASYIELDSLHIVLLRTCIGGLLLMALFVLTGGRFTFFRHRRQMIFLAVSGIAMGTSWMFLYEAYFRIGVGIASLLYYCGPVIVMVLSPLVFGEKLTGYKIAGFLSVLIGVVMLNGTAQGGSDPFGIL